MAANQASQVNDPGVKTPGNYQGYRGHYCEVPRRVDPGIVACTFIVSGLRVFDIRDPYVPKEIAYFNPPSTPFIPGIKEGNYAMSSAAFAPERGEIWYSDGNVGFFAVRLTNNARPVVIPAGTNAAKSQGGTAATGAGFPYVAAGFALVAAGLALALALRLRRLGAHD